MYDLVPVKACLVPVLTRISFSTINLFFKLNVYCCLIKEVVQASEEYTHILTLDYVSGTVQSTG